MRRTIIDILKKGNLELFHSAMIAWLLNPEGEHGWDDAFLRRFAELLAGKGHHTLQRALACDRGKVRTEESIPGRGRCDILLEVGQTKFVLENKVKSVGQVRDLKRYEGPGWVPIALAFCQVSFDEQVHASYPVVLYSDIRDLLRDLLSQPPDGTPTNNFAILIKHYYCFLKRELGLLEVLDSCFCQGDLERHSELVQLWKQTPDRTVNDHRFLNLYLLDRLRLRLRKIEGQREAKRQVDKNMQSGVWLAGTPSSYTFRADIAELCRRRSAELWFHLELGDGKHSKRYGVLGETLDHTAGTLQLRCLADGPMEFLEELYSLTPLSVGQFKPRRIQGGSFFAIGQDIVVRQLALDKLGCLMQEFMAKFGQVAGHA